MTWVVHEGRASSTWCRAVSHSPVSKSTMGRWPRLRCGVLQEIVDVQVVPDTNDFAVLPPSSLSSSTGAHGHSTPTVVEPLATRPPSSGTDETGGRKDTRARVRILSLPNTDSTGARPCDGAGQPQIGSRNEHRTCGIASDRASRRARMIVGLRLHDKE